MPELKLTYTQQDIEEAILEHVETRYPDEFHEAHIRWHFYMRDSMTDEPTEEVWISRMKADIVPKRQMPPQDIRVDEEDEKYARWHSDNVSDPYRKPVLDEEDEWRYRVWKGIYPEGTK